MRSVNADGLGTDRYSWTMILFPAWNLYLSRVSQVKHYSCSHSVVHTYNFLKSFTLQSCLGWNASFLNYLAVMWLNPGSIKCHTQPDPVTQLHCVIAVNYLNELCFFHRDMKSTFRWNVIFLLWSFSFYVAPHKWVGREIGMWYGEWCFYNWK